MDAAVTALTPANEAALLAEQTPITARGALGRLQALPARKKMMLGAGTAGLAALLVVLALWSRQVPMAPLYPQPLLDSELGAVLTELGKQGVPYEIGRLGSLVMVPAERATELRAKLSSLGYPKAPITGYSISEKTSFGQSTGQERTQKERVLGSLVESNIATISVVQSVKVIVALPQQTGFYADQNKPSASVALTLVPGRTLNSGQIAGIVNGTAKAVPGLSPKDVSITDQDGNWLTQPDNETNTDLSAQQRNHLRETEARLLRRVNEILEPALGPDNLRATVTAELDFNRVESTIEAYSPNQGAEAKASVRSNKTLEAGPSTGAQPTGVPGASSNQLPATASAPVTAASATPLQAAQGGMTGSGARRETVVNYEIDKTVELKRNAVGEIKRINVAVMVNHRSSVDPKTNKPISTPLSEGEMKNLTELVQEAVGYKKERGDSVRVVNIPFRIEPKVEPEAVPLWRQPGLLDLVRAGGMPAALTLVAMMLLLGVVRPALRPDAPPSKAESTLDAVVGGHEALPAPTAEEQLALEAPRIEKQLVDARAMARETPLAVANILRTWIDGAAA